MTAALLPYPGRQLPEHEFIRIWSCRFHPGARVLEATVRVQDASSHLSIDAGGARLANQSIEAIHQNAARTTFRIRAVLPNDIDPEMVRFGATSSTGEVRQASCRGRVEFVRAGIAGASAWAPGRALVEFWSESDDAALFAGRSLSATPLRRLGVCGVNYQSHLIRNPPEPPHLEVAPSTGRGESASDIQHWVFRRPISDERLIRLRNLHRGETAWIIGNGPSVKIEDLDKLADATTFTFNRFHLAHERTRLRSTYTVSADRQVIEDFGAEIAAAAPSRPFFANDYRPELNCDFYWVRQLFEQPTFFSRTADTVVGAGGSSVFVALQLAHYMGVRRVYLYGIDFKFNFRPVIDAADRYRSAHGDDNHFIANYRAGKAWCPPSFDLIAKAFFNAKVLFEADGGFIRNATRGGELEIFERLDFDAARRASAP